MDRPVKVYRIENERIPNFMQFNSNCFVYDPKRKLNQGCRG
jgi:hypothetical protein